MEFKILLRRPYHNGDTFALCSIKRNDVTFGYATYRLSKGNVKTESETVFQATTFLDYTDAHNHYINPAGL